MGDSIAFSTTRGFIGYGGNDEHTALIYEPLYSSLARNTLKRYDGDDYLVIEALFSLIQTSITNINHFYLNYLSDYDILKDNLTHDEFQLFFVQCENLISSLKQLTCIGVISFTNEVLNDDNLFTNTRVYGITKTQSNYEVFMNLRAVFGEHLSSVQLVKGKKAPRYVVTDLSMGSNGLQNAGYASVLHGCNTLYDLMYYKYSQIKGLLPSDFYGDTPHGLVVIVGRGDNVELIRLNLFDIYEFVYAVAENIKINKGGQ